MVPEENFPPKEEPAQEFWLEALVNQENKERTQYTVRIHADTSQPPRYIDSLKARYYFDISELVAAGQSTDDIKVEVYYDKVAANSNMEKQVKVSDPIQAEGNVYYVEMDWAGIPFRGAMELQLGIIVGQDANYNANWDPTNDYSREGLEISDEYGPTQNIPLYLGNKLVYGKPPVEDSDNNTPATTTAVTTSRPSKLIYGDVNLDGEVDLTDLSVLSLHLLGESKLTGDALKTADTEYDSKIDVADMSKLKQFVSKKISYLGPKK